MTAPLSRRLGLPANQQPRPLRRALTLAAIRRAHRKAAA